MAEIKCFRCGAQPKVLVDVNMDGTKIKFCPQCIADLGLFLEGHAVERYIRVEKGHYVRKEMEE